jgi:DNA-directed RNA polymerase specialized sigma24 family protein
VAGDTEPPGHLRGGDQEAFDQLARRHHASTVRLAATHAADRALAEQAARDAWLDALEGIDGQGGLDVKTWLFRLLIGRAAAAAREDRPPAGDPAAGPGRGRRDRRLGLPAAALARRCRAAAARAAGAAADRGGTGRPVPAPRRVVLLCDVEALTSGEVGQLLGINQASPRVLPAPRAGAPPPGPWCRRPGAGELMAWLRTGILCRKAADYLEDALRPRDRSRLEAHLAGCPHCTPVLAPRSGSTIKRGRPGWPAPAAIRRPQRACRPDRRWRSSQHQPS